MAPFVSPRAWVVPLAIILALATVAIVPQTSIWQTTYAGHSAAAAAADLSAGIGLIAVGSALIISDLRSSAGVAAILAGAAWLSADWVGWQTGPALSRTLAMGISLYYLPLIIHLLALSQRMPARWITGTLVPSGYAVASALAVGLLLFRDPRIDLHCWSNCTDDVLLIVNLPVIAGIVSAAIPAFELIAGGIIALVGILWIAKGTSTQQQLAVGVAAPAMLLGLASAAHGLTLLVDPHEGPRFALHDALFLARASSAALIAAGLGWTVIRASRSRSAVMRLAADLGNAPAPGRLGPALASATGDAGLEVLFWVPQSGGYVDGSGAPRTLPSLGPRRAVTRISHAGRHVAVVTHDPSVIGPRGLNRILGPANALALENERLRAALLGKLGEVRASRARIVSAGDTARAQLEHDLHDGAQQGLLSVAFELRQAAAAAEAHGDEEVGAALGAAVREAEAMLNDLREIAHGINPAILRDKGLGPAIASLADRAPIPVEVRGVPAERFPELAERTAYAVAASAIDAAAQAGAPELVIGVSRNADRIVLEIASDNLDTPPEIADRVGAVNGTLQRNARTMWVWIPCA